MKKRFDAAVGFGEDTGLTFLVNAVMSDVADVWTTDDYMSAYESILGEFVVCEERDTLTGQQMVKARKFLKQFERE